MINFIISRMLSVKTIRRLEHPISVCELPSSYNLIMFDWLALQQPSFIRRSLQSVRDQENQMDQNYQEKLVDQVDHVGQVNHEDQLDQEDQGL